MATKNINICVFGLWHLGCVTSSCLSSLKYKTYALDFDTERVKNLKKFKYPILEPGLDKIVKKSVKQKNLYFISKVSELPKALDFIWITFDTPVNNNDQSNSKVVTDKIHKLLSSINHKATIIISSQLPVGTARKLESSYRKKFDFVVIPENLRLGNALNTFFNQERIIVGRSNINLDVKLRKLLKPICENIHFMKTESAEMSKHAINSYLAMSISYANEIAGLCENVGAHYEEVELALRTENRIGPKAYISAGGAYAGGTLARDIEYLKKLSKNSIANQSININLIKSIKRSNDYHKMWTLKKIYSVFNNLKNKKIILLGLSYKTNSNTLRRSLSVEIGDNLLNSGAKIFAYDPFVKDLPSHWLGKVKLIRNLAEIIDKIDIIAVFTNHPVYKKIKFLSLNRRKKNIYIFDQNRYLKGIKSSQKVKYYFVGHPDHNEL